MIIQHNISSMNANRNLGISTNALAKSTEKLSSGYRINRAGDDAAGLAISEKMRGQIRGLDQASKNSEDSISLVQTAEGALQETQSILQRMRELAVQAANDTNTDDDRTQLQNEISQLTNEVDRIATTSEYNTMKLLDGSRLGSTSYRAGSSVVEGSFVNGYVKIDQVLTSVANTGAIDDVIRITFTKDVTTGTTSVPMTAARQPNGTANPVSAADAIVNSLNGNTVTFTLDGNGNATVTIAGAAYTASSVSAGSNHTAAITFEISGATNIKADDVITINLCKMQTTAPAEAGREALRLQVGANAGQEMNLSIGSMKAKDLGIVKTSTTVDIDGTGQNVGDALDVTSQASASMAIDAYDNAIRTVSTQRAKLGAVQNRLEHTIKNLDTSAENLQAAESAIRDVDMADEMTNYSKNNILMQAGQSMLAQANQSTQGALSLIQ
jgi:flagellin